MSFRVRDLRPRKIIGSIHTETGISAQSSLHVHVQVGPHTVGHNHRISTLDGFIGDGSGKVDGQED